ncbi:transglutaminaseTgpA domain-containing protein [Propionibacteriaceae bacterium Y1923]
MSRIFRPTDLMAAAVTVAMVLASLSLLNLTTDRRYLVLGIPVIVLVMLISAISRRLRVPAVLIHLWQLLALAGAVIGLGVNATDGGGNIFAQVWQALLDGILHIQTSIAPMPPNAGTALLLVVLLGLVTIIADVLVLTLDTPAWVAAPMLTLYLIPALALDFQVSWVSFVLLGLGLLVVLAADTSRTLRGWTRNLVTDDADKQHTTTGVWGMAAIVGVPVLAFSLLIGNVVPTMATYDLDSRRPRGVGPIQMQDPTIELHRNLSQQSEEVVISYTTDAADGQYLRMASLSVMEPDSWKLTAVQLQTGNLPNPPGLGSAVVENTTNISIGNFGSQYLPSPYAPSSFNAPGQWAFDPVTMMILSTEGNNTDATRNLEYSVNSVITDPDPSAFNSAQPGTPPDNGLTRQVPEDVPQEIVDLTTEVVADAETPVLQAAAIQAWLRDPRRFTYSTDAPAGDGFEVMRNFLLDDRQGYCIHFASAMALMARIAGIPSRVAVGFLPGTKNGDVWQVQAKEMHAWPELFFEGFGWVRFEPTAGVADAPAWTVVQGSGPTESPSDTPSPTETTDPSASTSGSMETPSATETVFEVDVEGNAFAWRRFFTIVGIVAVALALLLTPGVARRVVRRRRFAGTGSPEDQTEALWAEVRDTMRDVGAGWPAGSPREKVATLGSAMDGPAAEALTRIGATVEQARYSRGMAELPEQYAKDVRYVTEDVRAKQSGSSKVVSTLFPTSVFTNLGRRLGGK